MKFKPGTYQTQELIENGFLQIGDGYRAKNSELSSTGIPFARARNINDGFKFENADMFPIEDIQKVGEKKSQQFDSVFTSKGSVGRIAYVKYKTQEFVYSPQLCYWRSLDHDLISPRYLNYWMNGSEFKNQIDYLKGQTDMADYVSLRDQRKMTITIPDIEVQNEIAKILGDIDDKIELNYEFNQTLGHIIQAIFKSWFIDFDPVKAKIKAKQSGLDPERAAMCAISGKTDKELEQLSPKQFNQLAATAVLFPDDFDDSKLGKIPKGWSVEKLEDVIETTDYVANGSFAALKKNVELFDEENDVLYVRTTDYNNNFSANLKYTTNHAYEFLSKTKLFGREIVISNVGDVGTVFRPPKWLGKPMTLASNAVALISNEFSAYVFWYFKSSYGQHQIQSIVTGSAQLKFNKTNLRKLRMLWPDYKILTQFEVFENALDKKIINNNSEINSLIDIRGSLLPKLLSGEIEVGDAA